MSISETVTLKKGPCPCGGGYIAQHVTSQDNPWSSADVAYSLECAKCSSEWRLDGTTLVLRSSEVPHASAARAEEAAAQPLRALVRQIVAQHFASFTAPTKKAEHAELQRLGICNLSYRQYLEHRKAGGTIATAAVPARNHAWLDGLALSQGHDQLLTSLTAAHKAAKATRDQTYAQIVRKRVA